MLDNDVILFELTLLGEYNLFASDVLQRFAMILVTILIVMNSTRHRLKSNRLLCKFSCMWVEVFICLCVSITPVFAQDRFMDHGVGAKVAEFRGAVALQDAHGNNLVIALILDNSPRGYILVTDIDKEETKQYQYPPGVINASVFASLMSKNGLFYTGVGNFLLEFDPASREWLFHGIAQKDSRFIVGTAITDGPDELIYLGTSYPKTHLVSFNPKTKEMKDYGQLDPREESFNTLAFDSSNWAYAGIGTARWNIIAYNPKTGDRRQVIAEAERQFGTAKVFAGTDGMVYGNAGQQWFRLFKGEGEKIQRKEVSPPAPSRTIGYGQIAGYFPDGRQLLCYNLSEKWLEVKNPKTGKIKRITFNYKTNGAQITSLGIGPSGFVYASTAHPMHLLKLDTKSKIVQDLGPIPKVAGGNFCAITSQKKLIIGAQYPSGSLWAYDATKPWRLRKFLGIQAQELFRRGKATDGQLIYSQNHEVAFLRGDNFGAEMTFPLESPTDGKYYLHILPLKAKKYCSIQFLLDGKKLGMPYSSASSETQLGNLMVYGPLDLKAGNHSLTVRTLETIGQEPLCSIAAVELSQVKRKTLVNVDKPENPKELASWRDDICRPRTVLAHPDGIHVIMAGFADYGRCGGGLGIFNIKTGEKTLLTAEKNLLSGHSTITLKSLPNGDLVGGTSIDAPGGGHPIASEGEIYILDWGEKKITWHMVPVPGDGNIISIQVSTKGLIYGLSSNSTFFVLDSKSKQIVHKESFGAYGYVPFHALHFGPNNKLYAMLSKAIVEINCETFAHEKLADTPVPISAGGALVNGFLCFASGSHVWSYQILDLRKN